MQALVPHQGSRWKVRLLRSRRIRRSCRPAPPVTGVDVPAEPGTGAFAGQLFERGVLQGSEASHDGYFQALRAERGWKAMAGDIVIVFS